MFESDRSGTQQIYVMPAGGGEATRICFGEGRYGTPGLVAARRPDRLHQAERRAASTSASCAPTASEERLLTASFLDEGPTWAPNGRVLMFTRETAGAGGQAALCSVDITGRNLKQVPTEGPASDPAWSPLLP